MEKEGVLWTVWLCADACWCGGTDEAGWEEVLCKQGSWTMDCEWGKAEGGGNQGLGCHRGMARLSKGPFECCASVFGGCSHAEVVGCVGEFGGHC